MTGRIRRIIKRFHWMGDIHIFLTISKVHILFLFWPGTRPHYPYKCPITVHLRSPVRLQGEWNQACPGLNLAMFRSAVRPGEKRHGVLNTTVSPLVLCIQGTRGSDRSDQKNPHTKNKHSRPWPKIRFGLLVNFRMFAQGPPPLNAGLSLDESGQPSLPL